jgi:hypothetical protein
VSLAVPEKCGVAVITTPLSPPPPRRAVPGDLDDVGVREEPGSSGRDADAVTLTDPGALIVAGGSIDLAEVVLDAARDGDQ